MSAELKKILVEAKKEREKMKSLLYINPQSYTYKEFLQSAKKGIASGTNLLLHGFLSFCPDLGSPTAPASVPLPRDELAATAGSQGMLFQHQLPILTNPTLRSLKY